MIFAMKPRIKVMNERKIHVSRNPGFTAWLLLSLSAIIFIEISRRLTKNLLHLTVLVLGEIMFGLDAFGEWQDLVLDKDENMAIIKKYTWIDKLFFKVSQDSWYAMKLCDIRHIGVSMEMGLFILHRNGKTVSLSMQGFSRQELQGLKKEINQFLSTNQVERIDPDTVNLKNIFLYTSYPGCMGNASTTRVTGSLFKKIPISMDRFRNCKFRYPIRHNLSLPILGSSRQKRKHRYFGLRKRSCIEKDASNHTGVLFPLR